MIRANCQDFVGSWREREGRGDGVFNDRRTIARSSGVISATVEISEEKEKKEKKKKEGIKRKKKKEKERIKIRRISRGVSFSPTQPWRERTLRAKMGKI